MQQYLDLLKTIKDKGTLKPAARAGMPGTLSLFGHQMRFDLSKGFPILTTKKLSFNNIVTELLWFLKGDTNIKYLVDNGCNIWNEDAYNYYKKVVKLDSKTLHYPFEEFVDIIKKSSTDNLKTQFKIGDYILGDCGYLYGKNWRYWNKYTKGEYIIDEQGSVYYTDNIDQIKDIIEGLKTNPMSRRHILTSWNPAKLKDTDMAVNACHALVQFNCRPLEVVMDDLGMTPKYILDCQMYQRSADVFLGVPFNIASYALLTQILCKVCNMVPGEFIHSFGDVHIYENHMEQVNLQLTRTTDVLPKLVHLKTDTFWNNFDVSMFGHLDPNDFKLDNYNPQPSIKGKLSTGLK